MGNGCSIPIPCDAMATRCWDDCIRERAMYISKLEENHAALETAFQQLKEIRDDVVTRVNFAEQQQQLMRLKQVGGWLSRVAAVENEVDELIRNGPQEIEKLCLGGCCSKTCKSTYKFGKRVAQKLKDVIALKTEGDFKEVAQTVPASLGDVRPCDPAVGLESTFDKVWSCLQDEEVRIVGLYGIGGVGKTTLLTQINNMLLSTSNNRDVVVSNDLDVVVWVVVSKDLRVEKIQEDIGKKIGLLDEQWKSKSHDEKAIDVLRVLSLKKFILLLDDIWERVDLTKVGIPHPNIQNESKVIFTTRSEKVCHEMNARLIKVECLAWEKAWALFQEKVGEGTLSSHPDIPKLAETVAKECGGLPLALITTGRAMAGKRTPQQWKHAIEVLRKNAAEFSGMEDEVFPLLKFSYDNLRNDKVRSCFLYCALFPEDFVIYKPDLIDYWIGEGFLDGYDDRREPENEGYDLIGTLVQASLLEEDSDIRVKMHDVIRDLALWIASECGKVKDNYLVKAGAQLTEAPDVREWEFVRRMSLMINRIKKLTETPKCPNLLTLFLHDNHLKIIASEFFQFMPSLRVLDLSDNNDLKELPQGISKLLSLEYLNLSSIRIQQLPDELKTLAKLKYLNLEFTKKLNRLPHQFISSFSKLEVLRMYGSSKAVAESMFYEGNNELWGEELLCLKHLNTLSIDIISDSAFQRFLIFQKLQSCTRKLKCILNSLEQLNVSFLANMKRLEEFEIDSCESLQELKIDWASEGREIQVRNDLHNYVILSERCFHSLRALRLVKCPKLKDLTWLIILAPNLMFLQVINCDKMEEIISVEKLGEVPEVVGNLNPFAKIRRLWFWDLPELKSIYRSALPFPHLKSISMSNCPKLKKLPLNSNSCAKEGKIVIQGEEYWRKELEWEDEATQMALLPRFIS